MCIYKLAGLMITILFQVVYIHASYILSQNRTSWGSNDCIMASPEVVFENGEYLIKESQQLTSDMTSAWIGYHKMSMGFEYLDCVKTNEIVATKTFTIEGDPGQCFPGCGNTSTIGVSKTQCYCLEENYGEFKSERKCTTECSRLNHVVCGGREQYTSVYRRNANITQLEQKNAKTATTALTAPRNCLRFNPVNRVFQWDSCYFAFHTMCLSGNIITSVGDKFKNWIESNNVCFEYRRSPVPYMRPFNPDLPNEMKSTFWTGIFRTDVILKNEAISADIQSQSMNYGFIEYNSEERKHFLRLDKMKTSRRKTLCDINIQDSTTMEKTIVETTTTIQAEGGKKNSMFVTIESDVSTLETNMTQDSKSPRTEPTSNENLILYVTIGASLVLIITVIFIIVMIKRRFNRSCICLNKKQSSVTDADESGKDQAYFEVEPTGNTDNADYNYPDVDIASFSRTGNEADDSSNNYYELESRNTGSKFSQPLKHTTDDSTYDTMKGSTTEISAGGENIYNKLAADDNTYDTTINRKHLNNSNQVTEDVYNNLDEESANTYDTTISRGQDVPDEIYDKTPPSNDDTYSHVQNYNKHGNKKQTDNVYGDIDA